jgi:crotonobetainyl-CoA:carnitine CoA-transferase CaiB-like acyl-CoA transferase
MHPDYASQDARLRNRDALNAEIAVALRAKPTREWIEALSAAEIPAGPIYRMNEVFADPQVEHLGIAAPVHHPVRGDIRVVGEPVVLSRTPAAIAAPIAELGAHSDELLADLGYSKADIERLRANRII